MTGGQIEIIVGAIEIGRHHGNKVGAVLQVEALAHLQSGYLSQSVRLVGIFQRRREQTILGHRLRSFARIDTRASQETKLLYPRVPGTLNHVTLNLQITPNEIGPINTVGHNASHKSSRQEHILRTFRLEEGPDSSLVG